MNQPVRHLQNQWAGRFYQFATPSGFRYRWSMTQSCKPFAGRCVASRPCRIFARAASEARNHLTGTRLRVSRSVTKG